MSMREHFDCTRLTEPMRQALLALLSRASPPRHDSRRHAERYEYEVPALPVTLVPGLGSELKFLMHGRNLSCGGVSLLHGGFLHRQTRCSVLLQSLAGRKHLVTGEVVACRHVSRNIHEVCIQFFEKIVISEFCGPETRTTSILTARKRGGGLKGLALCLSRPEAVRREMVGWLDETGLDVAEATALGAAVDKLRRLPFAVALIDGDEGDFSGHEAVRAARDAGFAGAIVVVGGDQPRIEGADVVLPRPLTEETLHRAVSTLFIQGAGDEQLPIYTTLDDPKRNRTVLIGFVEQALSIASMTEGAMKADDRKRIIDAFESLKNTAVGYGFGVLGQAAATALIAVQRAKQLKQAERQVSLVVSLCRRLTAEPNPKSKAA